MSSDSGRGDSSIAFRGALEPSAYDDSIIRRKMSPRAPQFRWMTLLHSPVGARNLLGGHVDIDVTGSHSSLPFGVSNLRASIAR